MTPSVQSERPSSGLLLNYLCSQGHGLFRNLFCCCSFCFTQDARVQFGPIYIGPAPFALTSVNLALHQVLAWDEEPYLSPQLLGPKETHVVLCTRREFLGWWGGGRSLLQLLCCKCSRSWHMDLRCYHLCWPSTIVSKGSKHTLVMIVAETHKQITHVNTPSQSCNPHMTNYNDHLQWAGGMDQHASSSPP